MKPKLKHFLWKCMHNWLPTNGVVKKRGVNCEEICKRCGLDKESREHLFFHCQESKLIWKLAPIKWTKQQPLTGNFVEWWKAINNAVKDEQGKKAVELSVYLLWHIWKARNAWQFQGQKMHIVEVVKHAMQDWQEYGEINDAARKSDRQRKCRSGETKAGNNDPTETIIKVATESSGVGEDSRMGLLFVDKHQKILLAKALKCAANTQPCVAEMEAVRHAMVEAEHRNITQIEIHLDIKTMWLGCKEKFLQLQRLYP